MKKIKLSNGAVSLVDDEDYERVNRHKWCLISTGYCATSLWINGKRPILFLHRLILNASTGIMVDHINHNKLDNRKDNLRLCTNAENQWNSKLSSRNKSGYKGVSMNKKNGKWQTFIALSGKNVNLGQFSDVTVAAEAYRKAALEARGEFACYH